MLWEVPRIWQEGSCFIIGGGPSVNRLFNVPAELIEQVGQGKDVFEQIGKHMQSIHEYHCIGINAAFRLGSFIDILFFGDAGWYTHNIQRVQKFQHIKVSCNPLFANRRKDDPEKVKYMHRDEEKITGISTSRGKVAWNYNSGAASISLAVQLGVQRIFLLGFDMRGSEGVTHWHGGHIELEYTKGKKIKPPYERHLLGFLDIKADADKLGVQIYNVNDKSEITEFPIIDLSTALQMIKGA